MQQGGAETDKHAACSRHFSVFGGLHCLHIMTAATSWRQAAAQKAEKEAATADVAASLRPELPTAAPRPDPVPSRSTAPPASKQVQTLTGTSKTFPYA